MWEKITDLFYELDEHMPGICALIIVLFVALIGIVLGFGVVLFMAWVTMLLYNVLAEAMGWPMFSVWFWLGVWVVIGWIKKSIVRVKVEK